MQTCHPHDPTVTTPRKVEFCRNCPGNGRDPTVFCEGSNSSVADRSTPECSGHSTVPLLEIDQDATYSNALPSSHLNHLISITLDPTVFTFRAPTVSWPVTVTTRRIARTFTPLVLKIQKFICLLSLLKYYIIFYHTSPCSLS